MNITSKNRHRLGTPRDRALGAELRALRDASGLSLTQVAAKILWDVSTLSRLERGMRHISPEAVMGLAVIYDVPAQRRKELLRWAKTSPASGWWDGGPTGMPGELGALASYEQEATCMINWEPSLIPGLLQTAPFAAAVMRDVGLPESVVEARVEVRSRRQALLERRGVDYLAIIGTAALRNMLCGRACSKWLSRPRKRGLGWR